MSIILVNDYLSGRLGEKKVLWNYMLDFIPNLKGVDIDIMNQYNKFIIINSWNANQNLDGMA